MARRIQHDKGTIHARADDSDDDITFQYDKLKHVGDKAILLVVDGDDYWIPNSQLVDLYSGSNEARITKWIAEQKGLE